MKDWWIIVVGVFYVSLLLGFVLGRYLRFEGLFR